MLRHILLAAAIVGLVTSPVLAQDADSDAFEMPTFSGIAVAQAPEAGLGICFSSDSAEAMECAQHECMEQSGLGEEDCAVNLWCYPHGWTAQLAVNHVEGIHWTKVICDENSREDLEQAVATYCSKEYFSDCLPVRIWDHEGTAVLDYPAE
jgi:hypothetical protein